LSITQKPKDLQAFPISD